MCVCVYGGWDGSGTHSRCVHVWRRRVSVHVWRSEGVTCMCGGVRVCVKESGCTMTHDGAVEWQ